MGKNKKENKAHEFSQIDALNWKDSQTGMSYGHFVLTTTQEQKEEIYLQYSQMMIERKASEQLRLAQHHLEKIRKAQLNGCN